MPTLLQLIEQTRRILLPGTTEVRNKVAGTTTNTITMQYPLEGIHRGTRISVNLEDHYVWETTGLTVTVDGGQFGSTDAVSHAVGSTVYVDPKFSNWDIFNAINQEIVSLSSPETGLFGVQTTELTFNASVQGYNFNLDNVLDVLEVRYSVPGPALEYPLSNNWEISRKMSDEFPSGGVLFVRDAYPFRTVLVKAKIPFTVFPENVATDASATGLPATAFDILAYGAAWRLATPREHGRNDYTTQGDTRRADEVPAGAVLGGSRELGRFRQQRINEEVARLNQQYPRRIPRYPYAV